LLLLVGAWYWSTLAPRPAAAEPKATRLQDLLQERRQTWRKVVDLVVKQYEAGAVPLPQVLQARQSLLSAGLDLGDAAPARVEVLEEARRRAKEWEDAAQKAVAAGTAHDTVGLTATASRLEIEIALERLKRKGHGSPK